MGSVTVDRTCMFELCIELTSLDAWCMHEHRASVVVQLPFAPLNNLSLRICLYSIYVLRKSCYSFSLCSRFGLLVASNVRSATWRSTTNQRSALTTTRRMHKNYEMRHDLSVKFAGRSLLRKTTWPGTCRRYMVLVTSRPSSVTFALECSIANII